MVAVRLADALLEGRSGAGCPNLLQRPRSRRSAGRETLIFRASSRGRSRRGAPLQQIWTNGRRPCAPIAVTSAFAPPSAAERGPAAGCGRGGANCAGPQTGCGARADRRAGPMPPRPGASGGARRRPRGLSGTSPRVQRRRATEKSADAFARGARGTGRCAADAKSEHNAPAAPDDNMVTAAEGRTGDRGRTAGTGALRGAAGPRGRSPAPAGRLRGASEKPGRTGPAQETMVGDKADQCSS